MKTSDYYKKDYNKTLKYSNSDKEFKKYSNYFRKNYSPLLPADKNVTILDIGSGSGLFLRFLKKEGYSNIKGIDLSEENVSHCRELGFDVEIADAFEYLQKESKNFDLIVMNDVIEHIPKNQVVPSLEIIRKRLNVNGTLIMKTLNMSNPISLNTLYCDFTHEWGYTERNIEQACRLAGFENIQVYKLIIYPGIPLIDTIFNLIYSFIDLKFKLLYAFYGKKGYKVFSKNLLCVAKK